MKPSITSGRAFLVEHPRRKDQDYVTTDLDYLCHDFHQTVIDVGWLARISVVNYRGDNALCCTTKVSTLIKRLDELFPGFYKTWCDYDTIDKTDYLFGRPDNGVVRGGKH